MGANIGSENTTIGGYGMTEGKAGPTTTKFGGKVYKLNAKASAFYAMLQDKGMDGDTCWAMLHTAIDSGIMPKSAVKEQLPDYSELCEPVLARAMRSNSTLIDAVNAHFDTRERLDMFTASAGLGNGFEFGGSYAGHTRVARDAGDMDGVKAIIVHLDNDGTAAKVAQGTVDTLREAEAGVFAIARKVALKAGHDKDTPLKMNVSLVDRKTVAVKFGSSPRRSGGGGSGKRSKYDVTIKDGNVTIKLGDALLADGATRKELLEQLKENLPKNGINFYASQWTRKEWMPES